MRSPLVFVLAAIVGLAACSNHDSAEKGLRSLGQAAPEPVVPADVLANPAPEPAAEAPAPELAGFQVPTDSGAARAGQQAEAFVAFDGLTADADLRSALEDLKANGASRAVADRYKALGAKSHAVLLKAMWCDDQNVRTHAPTLLALLEPPLTAEVAAAFNRSLLYEPNPDVRGNVAAALTDYNVPGTATALVEVLEKDTNVNARSLAAYAVGLLHDKSAIPALIKATRDPETWVRLRSVKALGKMGDKAGRDAVKAALKDPNPLVRDNAKEAIGKLR